MVPPLVGQPLVLELELDGLPPGDRVGVLGPDLLGDLLGPFVVAVVAGRTSAPPRAMGSVRFSRYPPARRAQPRGRVRGRTSLASGRRCPSRSRRLRSPPPPPGAPPGGYPRGRPPRPPLAPVGRPARRRPRTSRRSRRTGPGAAGAGRSPWSGCWWSPRCWPRPCSPGDDDATTPDERARTASRRARRRRPRRRPARRRRRPSCEAVVAEISDVRRAGAGPDVPEPVDVELAGEGEFQDRLLADFEEDADELREHRGVPGGVSGWSSPTSTWSRPCGRCSAPASSASTTRRPSELVVRGAALTPYVRTTIAHELTHALDDQHFDLDRPEYDDADRRGRVRLRRGGRGQRPPDRGAYQESLSADERAAVAARRSSRSAWASTSVSIPLVLIELLDAPYTLGRCWSTTSSRTGATRRWPPRSTDPPHTSEQVHRPRPVRSPGSQRSRCPTRRRAVRSSTRARPASCSSSWCWPTSVGLRRRRRGGRGLGRRLAVVLARRRPILRHAHRVGDDVGRDRRDDGRVRRLGARPTATPPSRGNPDGTFTVQACAASGGQSGSAASTA